ncbi:hypothetical protein CBR_g39434 [Chara braunii]|uniref:Uncharacterized protein n=1 Tax=Chara braunii TaxID=69332 RepID=A0A388LRT1_CHABU|nr:hypothetical protein CBR_g39434 [Chara braunii]|eukprot:GBG84971.1 hypothetical protein CBR_g39434 [Chara braunii]
MKMCTIFDGIVVGRMVVVKEVLCSRDWVHKPELVFSANITAHSDRWYDVHVGGLYAIELMAAIGYNDDDLLSNVIFFAKKLHNIISNECDCDNLDTVGDVIQHVMSAIVEEHDGKLVDTPFYKTALKPLLRGQTISARAGTTLGSEG